MTTSFMSYVPCLKTSTLGGGGGDGNDSWWGWRSIKICGASATTKVGRITMTVTRVAGVNGKALVERTMIPTKKQFVDPFRQGVIILDGVGYRQTVVIRSYEVGTDKTATPQSIFNLLQETALNHVWMSGLLGDGFGATHGMMKNDLIWVVSRMQAQIDQYPIWGEILEIDTWVGASGKNGMRRDWEIRSHTTGIVFARATSTWVMMNQKTRKLSKMPDVVRGEISPWFIEKQAIKEESPEKIDKLDDNAKYATSGLQPKRSDLDMNKHVNNVKYIGWMLETIPEEYLENYHLSNIILEYRRECGSSDVVQSLCEPEEVGIIKDGVQDNENRNVMDRCSNGVEGLLNCLMNEGTIRFTHLVKEEGTCQEIIRGKTTWKKRINLHSFSG
uniref:palmitoyl-acyl carrier protein thioesterase, chloroplastic-like n=1 Tax=Erigeron canadensis TaxID=72917 RepID=UPI001CB9BCA7|nr:palmitoyl-acyl carrier protein thioesterase, chloroplastic-like [Erigeron canadensis]